MKEVNNDKRVLQVEIGNNVKKVDITGKDADDKVVMRQELSEDDLNLVTGGNLYAAPTGEKSVIGGMGGTRIVDGERLVAAQPDLSRMGLSADVSPISVPISVSSSDNPGEVYKISFGG